MAIDLYEEIVELRAKGLRAALATIIVSKGATPRKDSAKMLVYADGRQSGSIGGGFTEAEVCREALVALRTGRPKLLSFDLTGVDHEESALVCGGFMQVYVEPVIPDPTLFILGAGFVSRAVAEAVKPVGFKIAVVDDRMDFANADKFPMADSFYVDRWEEVLKKLPVNDSSYLFIATRGHSLDLLCLRFALQSPARYIGMLGSLSKNRSLFELLEKEGVDPAQFKRVCVPVGIDIAAETAEEIAASMAAELIAVRKNLDIQSIRDALRKIRNSGPL
ncbi:MAG TPA: XdhC/CoxI family protein [Acidobacteriota bacterium]|nr:XdhC/CoxI family protein [Acidobacteriota bacterium]